MPVVSVAQTAAPACPSAPPAPSESADPVVAELRELRREVSASCDVAADRLGSLSGDLAALTDEVANVAGSTGSISDALEDGALRTRVLTSDAEPLHVAGDPSGDSAPVVAAVTDARDWLHADLWWLLGLLCALFFAGKLYRAVSPRA